MAKRTELALKEKTTVQIIDSAYNFGKVTDGEKVEYSYRFKNTGNKSTSHYRCQCQLWLYSTTKTRKTDNAR